MLSLRDYIEVEIFGDAKEKRIKIFIKALLTKGNKNALLLLRCYLLTARKKGIYRLLSIIFRNKLIKVYNIYIAPTTEIGLGLNFPHPAGIVFGLGVKIGRNCTVFQHVTFGLKELNSFNEGCPVSGYPIIGDSCVFYAGAKVIGPIVVADGSVVGANAVLMQNTDANSIYVGIPAKKCKKKE